MSNDYVLELPNELDAIDRAVAFLLERGEEAGFERERLRLNFRVGLSEALVNAILYGNDGDPDKRVRVEAAFDTEKCSVRITDEGPGFDPSRVPDPTHPDNRGESGGRGVFLIRMLMDHVEYNERGNSVLMVLNRKQQPAAPEPLKPGDRTAIAAEIGRLTGQYRRAFPERHVRVWARQAQGWSSVYTTQPGEDVQPGADLTIVTTPAGVDLALEVDDQGSALEFFSRALEMVLSYEDEARSAAREIAERYEEINLLYSISEVLGSVVSLPAAAQKILSEVAETLGGRRASLWIHDERSDRLVLAAAVGEGGTPDSIAVDDPKSVTARVFRDQAPLNVERGASVQRGNEKTPRPSDEAFVSVPISYTPPEGETRIIGVITLIGRIHHERFSAGDARLLAAVASQVGAALETQRLMEESVRRQSFQRELELAHDLQMKLLPSTEEFRDGRIKIEARCVPADSVGGDFYHLVRLSDTRCAVVIGDVSSHGFAAAMIMALTMSAIGIYARETDRPAEVLRHLHRALVSELESTEMYMTIWYGIVDAEARSVTYANAGHAYAFVLRGDGTRQRMDATNPPLGLLPLSEYGEGVADWNPETDLVCLFTDGLSDALAQGKVNGETELLDRVAALADQRSDAILARVFADTQTRTDLPPDDRTALIIRG